MAANQRVSFSPGTAASPNGPTQRTLRKNTLYGWGQTVALPLEPGSLEKIMAGFKLQSDEVKKDKAAGRTTCNLGFRGNLMNHNELGTGTVFVVPGLYGTTLEVVWGAGKYSEGLVSESSYQGRSIGLLSDRTLHSEPAPGIFTAGMWKYHTNKDVSAGTIGLNTHYTDKKNRFEFYESQDDKKTYDYMPSFLILPKELVAWFLDKEPTPFECLKMIVDDLLQGGAVPEELELATAWLINCCNKVTNMRYSTTAIRFSKKDDKCAKWVKERVDSLLGPGQTNAGSAQQGVTPTTPSQSAPAPAVTPSPTKKVFLSPSQMFMATITILSNQTTPTSVSPVWAELTDAADVSECAALLRAYVEKMREHLGVTDGRAPILNYDQFVTDLKSGKLAPGGPSFAYILLGQGISVLQCRQATSEEIVARESSHAAANATGSNLTFANNLQLQRRDPATPASNWAQLLKCITAYGSILASIFTKDCKHFLETWALRELIADNDREDESYFKPHTCRLILWAILRDANNFFGKTFQPADLSKPIIPFPASSLVTIGDHISNLTTPPTPANFPPKWLAPEHKGGGGGVGGFGGGGFGGGGLGGGGLGGGGGGGGGDGFGQGVGGNRDSPVVHADFKQLMAPLAANYPRIALGTVCTAANTSFARLPFLNNAGHRGNMCFRHLFGQCRHAGCTRYHAEKAEVEYERQFRADMCRVLAPGVQKILKDGPPTSQETVWRPRKRTLNQR